MHSIRRRTLVMILGILVMGQMFACNDDDKPDECMDIPSPQEWANHEIASQGSIFSLEFEATPSDAPMDTVIGLSSGAAADYADLAVAVRLEPDEFPHFMDAGDVVGLRYALEAESVWLDTAGLPDDNTGNHSDLVAAASQGLLGTYQLLGCKNDGVPIRDGI